MSDKEYSNTNRGVLFKNSEKMEETHSDYNGSINIEGKEYWLNAWVKTAGEKTKKPGQKFFSLSVKEKNPSPNKEGAKPPPYGSTVQAGQDDFSDEIPF